MPSLEYLFEIGQDVYKGIEFSTLREGQEHIGAYNEIEYKIKRLNQDTVEFERLNPDLNKKYHECGLVTRDKQYWRVTTKGRKRKLNDDYYITLMKFDIA